MNTDLAVVPSFLKDLPGWLLWKSEAQGAAKPRKVPYYANGNRRNGTQGSPDDRRQLVSHSEALAALHKGGYTGLGFAMHADWGIVGLDFDNCVTDGELEPTVADLVMGAYTEFSPSGTGIHAFMKGELPDKKSTGKAEKFGFEVFCSKGFLTFTGLITDDCEMLGASDTLLPLSDEVKTLCQLRFGNHVRAEYDLLMTSQPIGWTLETAAEVVKELDPNLGYHDWIKVGMALHHEFAGSEAAFVVWDAWSSKGDKYPGLNKLNDHWRSFKNTTSEPVTARWLRQQVNKLKHKGDIILDPASFPSIGKAFHDCKYQGENLVRVGGAWYEYAGKNYIERSEENIDVGIYNYLAGAMKYGPQAAIVPFNPTNASVANVKTAVRAVAAKGDINSPSWLPGHEGPAPHELISMSNGILHIPTRRLLPHSPGYFTLNTLPFDYDTGSEPREWLAFLNSVFPDDDQSIDTLQEMMGYLVSGDKSLQKMFLFIGPPRSGKGTIGKILEKIMGVANVAYPQLSNIGGQFGLEPLIGKSLAIFPDVRIGGKTDKHLIVDRLNSISGNDGTTVDRKNRTSWTGNLNVRFVFSTNEMPQLVDASGAFAGRFIIFAMRESFYGKEDIGLAARLLQEVTSIFGWALNGWDRLNERGYFMQPKSGEDALEDLKNANSPVREFVNTECQLSAYYSTTTQELYQAWRVWCHENGRDLPGQMSSFIAKLRAAYPALDKSRPRVDGVQVPHYQGIRLNPRIDLV